MQGTDKPVCITAWIYMNERTVDASGPGLGTLAISIRSATEGMILGPAAMMAANMTSIWRLTNYAQSQWFYAQSTYIKNETYQVSPTQKHKLRGLYSTAVFSVLRKNVRKINT